MVLVYILSDEIDSPNIQNVRNIFSHHYFSVSVLNVVPESLTESKTNNKIDKALADMTPETREYLTEKHRVQVALKSAKNNHPNEYVIITKDTSITTASPETIYDLIKTLKHSGDYHLAYLCKWLDRCDLYIDKKPIENSSAIIAKTQSPHGIQSIMFSPLGRDVVLGFKPMKNNIKFKPTNNLGNSLNTEILNANLDATCIVPNLINFNPTLATKYDDYKKSTECDWDIAGKSSTTSDTTSTNVWYIFLIILILALLIFAIYKLKNGYYARR